MTAEPSGGFDPFAYLAVVYRWKWLVVGVITLSAIVGFAYVKTRTPLYQATARLLYSHPVIVSNPLTGGSDLTALRQPDWGTASSVITGNQVGAIAAGLLGNRDMSAGYLVTVPLPPDVTLAAAREMAASVLSIDAASTDPQTAAAAANAYAKAFIEHRRKVAQDQVRSLLATVRATQLSFRTSSSRRGLEYAHLAQSEETLRLQLQTLTADYEITEEAVPPPIPFYPALRRTLAKFVALGLVLGTGLAFLLENLDTRPRGEREVAESLDLPVVGRIPLPLSQAGGATAEMLTNPLGPVAESVRELRGNLSFASVDSEMRTLLLTSAGRGEGKTFIACELAIALALAGQRITLVDADLRHPGVHAYMRIANTVGLSSVLSKRAKLEDAVFSIAFGDEAGAHTEDEAAGGSSDRASRVTLASESAPWNMDAVPALRVLPAGPLPPNPGEMAASERFCAVTRVLADSADIVIIDSPPLLEVGDAAAVARRVDGLLFVTSTKRIRWPALGQARTRLAQMPCRPLGLVLIDAKHAPSREYGYRYGYGSTPESIIGQGRD